MSVTVNDILGLLQQIAPVELAEEWDNVGLLVGERDASVATVLCALDLNQCVLDEAIEKGAQMIVTHHPVLFRGRQKLTSDDAEGKLLLRLIRSGISLAAMHTNFDNAHPGINDALAEVLGLKYVEPAEHGMCVGTIDELTFREFRGNVETCLGGPVRAYGDPERRIRRVAVLGGAGEDFVSSAAVCGADVYVTGEMSYHKGLSAVDNNICVLEAGHAATEKTAISKLGGSLQIAADSVQYNVHVLCSSVELFL